MSTWPSPSRSSDRDDDIAAIAAALAAYYHGILGDDAPPLPSEMAAALYDAGLRAPRLSPLAVADSDETPG